MNNSQQFGVARMRSVVGSSKRPRTAPQVDISSHRAAATRVYLINAASALRRISRGLQCIADIRRTSKMSALCGLGLLLPNMLMAQVQFTWLNQSHYNGFGYDTEYYTSTDIQYTISNVIAHSERNEVAYPAYNPRFCAMTITGGSYKTGLANYPYAIPIQNYVAASQGVGEPCYRYDNDKIHMKNVGAFVRAKPSIETQCGRSCNSIGHPINPATGSAYDITQDVGQVVAFDRYYNSSDGGVADISAGWRHAYGRSITTRTQPLTYQSYSAGDPDNSSLYVDEATACTSGFVQIRARVASWSGAVASYANGNCTITNGGVTLEVLPIYFNYSTLPSSTSSTPLAYDVARDDGQLIRFTVINGIITAPPGASLQLAQISNGFTVTDANNNIEQYDSSGKLLSITSRAGVVQTMNYDGSGHLSSVVDSFGHQLTFVYDVQGRLSSVTRK